jgi:hypothetical protein
MGNTMSDPCPDQQRIQGPCALALSFVGVSSLRIGLEVAVCVSLKCSRWFVGKEARNAALMVTLHFVVWGG